MSEAELAQLFLQTAERMERRFDDRFDRLEQRFDLLEQRVDGLERSMWREFQRLDQKIDNLAILVEHLDAKVDLVAEGVLQVDDKLERRAGQFEERMAENVAETHALIRYTHAAIERLM